MFLRAWRRVLDLTFSSPGRVIKANLVFTGLLLLPLPLWALGSAFQAGRALRLGMAGASALWIWCCVSWLCFALRDSLEERATPLADLLRGWWRARAKERALSFLAASTAAVWIGFALFFYAGERGASRLGRLGFLVAALMAILFALSLMLDMGLASRSKVRYWGEWKAAMLMAFLFFASSLAGGVSLLLFSGALFFLVPAGPGWLAGLLCIPAFFLPVAGAGILAGLTVALSDEFLARSLGMPSPGPDTGSLKQWLRPWE